MTRYEQEKQVLQAKSPLQNHTTRGRGSIRGRNQRGRGRENFNTNEEFFKGISGTYGAEQKGSALTAVKSLRFYANLTEYGLFGPESETSFSLRPKNGVIKGVHGRSGSYIYSIGVYPKPVCSVLVPVPASAPSELAARQFRNKWIKDITSLSVGFATALFVLIKQMVGISEVMTLEAKQRKSVYQLRSLGAWGGNIEEEFDDGVFSQIDIDSSNEFLMGVEGIMVLLLWSGSIHAMRSLTFHTNRAKYGPLGTEIGTFFTSNGCHGKVVGFFGKSGAYPHAIGVHIEYL
ncbi:hypothetical protein CDL12_14291 [Handroanthus impetiginosus]|uniref:Jacalin-type lectin domain-containing protein n=1 Tax=Handroanthus impetiginosus TaxID=429701 RepID=A0A2G9H6D6_9LAMI|nr:hypothetical protein CDL12_14291 [Handroanthus impetiginosus]